MKRAELRLVPARAWRRDYGGEWRIGDERVGGLVEKGASTGRWWWQAWNDDRDRFRIGYVTRLQEAKECVEDTLA